MNLDSDANDFSGIWITDSLRGVCNFEENSATLRNNHSGKAKEEV